MSMKTLLIGMFASGLMLVPFKAEQNQTDSPALADVELHANGLLLLPTELGGQMLTIAGPDGFYRQTHFPSGEIPYFSSVAEPGMPEGYYKYELLVESLSISSDAYSQSENTGRSLDAEEGFTDSIPHSTQVGYFYFSEGELFSSRLETPEGRKLIEESHHD